MSRVGGGFLSNKPIRRTVHAGRGLGTYAGLSQIGGYTASPFARSGLRDSSSYLLNPSQIQDLLQRNPSVASMEQGLPPSGSWSIGYQFTDAVYGNVLISVDATGNWNYVANSPIASSVVNAGPYQSPVVPPGTTSCTDSISDFLGCVQSGSTTILLLAGAYIAYRLLK